MFKKTLFLIVSITFLFSGCTGTRQIDKASIVETVSVSQQEDSILYTFYLLEDTEKVESTVVKADSFEKACKLAEEKYIPNAVFDKVELFLVDEKIYSEILLNDLKYVSKQSDISPLMYISICDNDTFDRIKEEKELPEQIRNHIDMLKKKQSKVNINALSIFNHIKSNKHSDMYVSSISCKEEIVASEIKITV